MINVALIGIGRIGQVHAANIEKTAGARLGVICDTRLEAARIAAGRYGATCSSSPEEVIQDKSIDAVFVCTPARTHIDLAEAAVANGKYVFCEKPLDEDLNKARRFVEGDPTNAARVMIGFHRRYDESHRRLRDMVESRNLGQIEQIIINSRDPRLDSYDVLRNTGGIFRDMMMHDIDQALLLIQRNFTGVFARAACLVDPIFAECEDFDNAVATFWTKTGATCTIVNSRRSTFGFEQTIEIFCEKGTASIRAPAASTLSIRHSAGEQLSGPNGYFIERYQAAYQAECRAFFESIESGKRFPATAVDGLRALRLADAADRSVRLGEPVKITE